MFAFFTYLLGLFADVEHNVYPLIALGCVHESFEIRGLYPLGGSVAEWLACWTQAQKGPGSNHSHDAVG